MAREGKSYLQIVKQWRRITDELERRSGGVQYTICGDDNIARYERATEAAARYTRNIEHTPEGQHPLPDGKGDEFLNKVFPRSTYMGTTKEAEKKELHFEDVSVFKQKDGSHAVRGSYQGQHLPPRKISDVEWKTIAATQNKTKRDAGLQKLMTRLYADEIKTMGQQRRNGLSL